MYVFGRDSQVSMGVEALQRKKGKASGDPDEVVSMRKLEPGRLEAGHPVWLVGGVYFSFSGWS